MDQGSRNFTPLKEFLKFSKSWTG